MKEKDVNTSGTSFFQQMRWNTFQFLIRIRTFYFTANLTMQWHIQKRLMVCFQNNAVQSCDVLSFLTGN